MDTDELTYLAVDAEPRSRSHLCLLTFSKCYFSSFVDQVKEKFTRDCSECNAGTDKKRWN